jgi:Na+/proline symporter
MSMTHELRIRRAAHLVLAGLVIQLACTLHWTPLTFVLFAMLGVPLVLLGVCLYVSTVWRILKERKAL